MKKKPTIIGARNRPEKMQRAKELRKNMTPAERRLWQVLRANRLDGWHFRRQHVVLGYIVDFYCHKVGLVIEVDGPIHEHQREADAYREKVLVDHGLRVIRFTNRDVMNDLERVKAQIRHTLNTLKHPDT